MEGGGVGLAKPAGLVLTVYLHALRGQLKNKPHLFLILVVEVVVLDAQVDYAHAAGRVRSGLNGGTAAALGLLNCQTHVACPPYQM